MVEEYFKSADAADFSTPWFVQLHRETVRRIWRRFQRDDVQVYGPTDEDVLDAAQEVLYRGYKGRNRKIAPEYRRRGQTRAGRFVMTLETVAERCMKGSHRKNQRVYKPIATAFKMAASKGELIPVSGSVDLHGASDRMYVLASRVRMPLVPMDSNARACLVRGLDAWFQASRIREFRPRYAAEIVKAAFDVAGNIYERKNVGLGTSTLCNIIKGLFDERHPAFVPAERPDPDDPAKKVNLLDLEADPFDLQDAVDYKRHVEYLERLVHSGNFLTPRQIEIMALHHDPKTGRVKKVSARRLGITVGLQNAQATVERRNAMEQLRNVLGIERGGAQYYDRYRELLVGDFCRICYEYQNITGKGHS
ncbi:MAG: hypothetical protein A3I06_09380 [Candidatus Lindowbacteria bacterium RIFCSPLOWO2_02_FULL_62_12]|nr:MAG: hypothetical protein A3I06_09380 [Candidatus Lindowbacteria bacterium RIFCSPLOWO2_02_FULL_62_12]